MSSDLSPFEFRYRFVPFGTKFTFAAGARALSSQGGAGQLFENEVVTDVGGVCWGHGGEMLPVIDHHFFRDSGQYPSAAAAVLHNAPRLKELANSLRTNNGRSEGSPAVVWLVTHIHPDFDALSSLYLVRRLLEGALESEGWEAWGIQPGGWQPGRGIIDWFQPQTASIPTSRRWAILLAAEASRTDNCRNSRCARERQLASVLCAAMERGRPYADEQNGGVEFFDEVRMLLNRSAAMGLDPYFDSVLEQSLLFRPELALLDREIVAYERDLRRARKLIVYVPEAKVPFSQWFPDAAATPLLDQQGELHSTHIDSGVHGRRAVDGLFLRDPESLLFKNWARSDTDHCALGRGFTFTAIVYSHGRPGGLANTGDYYFAIDPESAGRMHLYPVWAQLQKAEIDALNLAKHQSWHDRLSQEETEAKRTGGTRIRPAFEARAGVTTGMTTLGFDDPWFDGQNYGCTIVPTPNRGTLLGPAGTRSDLSDDPVAQIVLQELTDSVFGNRIVLQEFLGTAEDKELSNPRLLAAMRKIPPVKLSGYRSLTVELDKDVDLQSTDLVQQISAQLWRYLDENRAGVPAYFAERHIFRGDDWLGVWNERGIVVAYRSVEATARAEELQDLFEKICHLALEMRMLIEGAQKRDKRADLISQLAASEKLLVELALRLHEITKPENALIRKFFEASRLGQSLEMVRDIHAAAADRMEAERIRELAESQDQTSAKMSESVATLVSLQQKLEYVEVGIVLVYAAELTHILAESFEFAHFYTGLGVLICPFFAALAAYCWLIAGNHHGSDEHHSSSKRPSTAVIVTLIATIGVIGVFIAAGLLVPSLRKGSNADSRASETHSEAH